jgi:biotin carboxylase
VRFCKYDRPLPPAPILAQGIIPPEVFNKACVTTAEEAAAMATKIGYPVMIKASEGGGGKGIRVCHAPAELRTNFIQVCRLLHVSWDRDLLVTLGIDDNDHSRYAVACLL